MNIRGAILFFIGLVIYLMMLFLLKIGHNSHGEYTIARTVLEEPELGERMLIQRSQEYGFVMNIKSDLREISLI